MNSAATDNFQFYTFGSDFSPSLHLSLLVITAAERQQRRVERAPSLVSDLSGFSHCNLESQLCET